MPLVRVAQAGVQIIDVLHHQGHAATFNSLVKAIGT